MRHFLIDLDNTLKTLLLDDTVVLDFHEIAFSGDSLSALDEMIKGFKPDRITFITHNTMATCLYEEACVAFDLANENNTYLSLISKKDAEKLIDLCKQNGITDIKFVDKVGYYAFFNRHDVCYVEKFLGLNRIVVIYDDSIKEYSICTDSAINERLEKVKEVTGVTEVVYENNLQDICGLMYFANGSTFLDDDMCAHDLSVFVYACTADQRYTYGEDVITRDTETIIHAAMSEEPVVEVGTDNCDQDSNSDSREEQIDDVPEVEIFDDVSIDKPKRRVKKEKKVTCNVDGASKFGTISNTVFIVGLATLVLTAALFVYNQRCVAVIEKQNKVIESNQSLIDSVNTAISTYQTCLETETNKASVAYMALFNGSVSGCELQQLQYTDGVGTMTVLAESNDVATAFVGLCTENGLVATIADGGSAASDDGTGVDGGEAEAVAESDVASVIVTVQIK